MSSERWEHFHHEADIGVRGIARTKEEAFEQAALALTAAVTDVSRVTASEKIALRCSAPDDELLFVDWLNAIVYEMATRKMLFARFEVHLDGSDLQGHAWGESIDVDKHQPAVEVKGATYTSLRVHRDEEGLWQAQCVVDV